MSLENITNDFLESNVTGEVMNLDDFLKELQVNELAQQTEELSGGLGRGVASPPLLHSPGQGRGMQQHGGLGGQEDTRWDNLSSSQPRQQQPLFSFLFPE